MTDKPGDVLESALDRITRRRGMGTGLESVQEAADNVAREMIDEGQVSGSLWEQSGGRLLFNSWLVANPLQAEEFLNMRRALQKAAELIEKPGLEDG